MIDKIGQEIKVKARFTQLGQPFKIWVKVMDYKKSYGKHRFLLKPRDGEGEAWVQLNARDFK